MKRLFGDNWSLRFSVRGFGCAPFLYADRRTYEQREPGKDNWHYRRRRSDLFLAHGKHLSLFFS
jgi:hypothetical protein